MIRKAGYPAEAHIVQTQDGYLLTLHRIPNNKYQPVLLQHGLLCSSADWVIADKDKGLGTTFNLKKSSITLRKNVKINSQISMCQKNLICLMQIITHFGFERFYFYFFNIIFKTNNQ